MFYLCILVGSVAWFSGLGEVGADSLGSGVGWLLEVKPGGSGKSGGALRERGSSIPPHSLNPSHTLLIPTNPLEMLYC